MTSVRLGEVARLDYGFAFDSKLFNTDGRGLPLVRIRDVLPGRSDTYYSGEYVDRYLVDDGDYLIGMDGQFNLARWRGGKALLNQRVCRIGELDTSLDRSYLARFMPLALKAIEDATPFVTVKHLSAKALNAIQVPLPSLPEQRRIAAILDHADALRAKRHQVLAHFDSLTQSIFHEMFDGTREFRPLGEVADFFGGASLPAGEAFSGQRGGVLLMKVSDMNAAGNEDEVQSTALWTSAPTARAGTVSAGAVLLPKRGASIATNKKRLTTRATCLDPNLMGVQPRPMHLASRYLHEWFKSFDLATITSGSTVPQLNKQDLAPLVLPVPPLDLQRVFSARIERVFGQRTATQRALMADDELFASLQARAFRGEL